VTPPQPSTARNDFEQSYSDNLLRQLMDVSGFLNRRLLELSAETGHDDLKMSFAVVMAHAGLHGARLSDIAAKNGLSKQAVSQTARELADRGYIRLLPDPDDARARVITLTPHGRALIADSLRSIETIRAELAAQIGAEALAAFEKAVATVWACSPQRAAKRAIRNGEASPRQATNQ
jgi:DNA-binding MarR family transcriptional regulator